MTTEDIIKEFKEKYKNGEFRVLKDGTKTIEIQNAHFIVDKGWIIREPNKEYIGRELEWYLSESLNVSDIPGETPIIWKSCADIDGNINSNYGWCIFSKENGQQYNWCLKRLLNDQSTREAVMIYNRPSMQWEATDNGRHDFMCTYSVQCFLNPKNDGYELLYIVYMRSNDAVFGFNNDAGWHQYVYNKLKDDLEKSLKKPIYNRDIEWNAGSLHVYERHFKYLED